MLSIRVLDLTRIHDENIDDVVKNKELLRWARIFKAESEEELANLVADSEVLKNMIYDLSKMSEEDAIKYQRWAEEDYERLMNEIAERVKNGEAQTWEKIELAEYQAQKEIEAINAKVEVAEQKAQEKIMVVNAQAQAKVEITEQFIKKLEALLEATKQDD